MIKWEYYTTYIQTDKSYLNFMGKDGWELCVENMGRSVFKRPIEVQEVSSKNLKEALM